MEQTQLYNMKTDTEDIETYLLSGGLLVSERFFRVPLNYNDPTGSKITIFARIVRRNEVPIKIKNTSPSSEDEQEDCVYLCYLNGGPGFNNGSAKSSFVAKFLEKGYTVILLDQRGTGLSECITSETIPGNTAEEKADYVSNFRADNIVKDCEFVRKQIVGPEGKWCLAGQSFGGFCIATYLSFTPQYIAEAFMFGGIPPISEDTPDQVYTNLYEKVKARNLAYYKKYPKDISRVLTIASYLVSNTVTLPSGGTLSVERFRGLGISFGTHGGIDAIHGLVFRMSNDLSRFGKILRPTLMRLEEQQDFDYAVLYCILHESIYCQDGNSSRWSASREPRETADIRLKPYDVYKTNMSRSTPIDNALFFTGEMVYPSMLDDYASLRPIKDVANILAAKKWPGKLYDLEALSKNTVPVYAATYVEDMYVDFGLTRKFAGLTGNFREFITNSMYHDAIRVRTDEVVEKVWELRGGCVD